MKAYGVVAALLCLIPCHSGAAQSVVVTHYEPLQRLTLERGASTAQQKIQKAAPARLAFDALSRSFEVQLEPNDRLLSQSSRASLLSDVALYRGRLAGRTGSWARIVIADDEPRGLIWDGEEMFVIEASGDSAVQTDAAIVYRLADTYVTPGTLTCGVNIAGGSAATMYTKLLAGMAASRAAAPGANTEMRISAIGDFQFVERIGAGAEAAILTRLNNVDGIFSEQLGVQLTVETLEVHPEQDDPFTDTLDSDDLLDELGIYRRDSPQHRSQGLTHLYTGRNLATTTVGIAYMDALCSARFGAGLTEGRHGALFESLISAHEIGHNFGAPHDAEDGSACVAEAEDFIMAGSVNGSDQFSRCSIAEMQPGIAAAACISVLPSVDMRVALEGSVPDVLLGTDFNLSFEMTNVGTETASNVVAAISLPENVSLISVDASSGSCTTGTGTASCELGTVPGGSNRRVTLVMRATGAGSGALVTTVSAEGDDHLGNNNETVEVTITPAVDLVVHALPSVQVSLNQSRSLSAQLENRSILDATAVELSISISSGLEARAAEWSLGSCSVSPQQVDCEANSFASQSAATLNMTVVGTTAGARNFTVALSSTEVDADTSNNSAQSAVTVTAASADSSSSGGGGGGAAGWLFLWVLGSAVLRVRSRLVRQRACA